MISGRSIRHARPSVTYREGSRGISGSSPAGTPVQAHSFIGDDLEEATATEGLRICLTLDLQDVQRKQDDLTNTDQTGSQSQFLKAHYFIEAVFVLTCQQLHA